MKPWEEEWRHSDDHTLFVVREPIARFDCHTSPLSEDFSRAKLASAAPDMARLLLDLHEEGAFLQGDGIRDCHFCGAMIERVYGFDHKPDCVLVAVLRKAGVLP